jgi:tRNA(adenine34) deaminase
LRFEKKLNGGVNALTEWYAKVTCIVELRGMNEDSELSIFSDEHYMQQALHQAEAAFEAGEVPIGAVVVVRNRIIGRGHNQTELLQDATAHAEMLAITAASDFLGSKFLDECTLYVTVEPCVMCAGALAWVRVKKIVYGAAEPKSGYQRFGEGMLHPKTNVVRGVLEDDCRGLMQEFFRSRREEK